MIGLTTNHMFLIMISKSLSVEHLPLKIGAKMITLNQAMEIVKNNDAFYYKDEKHKGKKFRIFNYRLASYSDFANNNGSLELRGLTFDLETEKAYLGLHKFFNDNENPFTMIEWNEDDVLDVREKLDGSLIQAFYINDKLFVKTKGTFKSDQAKMAEKFIMENENYQKFIKSMNKLQYSVFFELVSPFNQIVVQYDKTDLRLIQIRDEFGNYMDYNFLKKYSDFYDLSIANEYKYTLSELRELQKIEKNIEGWVVRNPKYPLETQFRKFKTLDYFEKHKLLTGNSITENTLIQAIINETIDDIISQLDKNSEKRKYIEEIEKVVSQHFDKTLKELEELFNIRNNMNRKDFALKYKDHPYFGVIMKAKSEDELEKLLKEVIIKRTQKLNKAREFLKMIGLKND